MDLEELKTISEIVQTWISSLAVFVGGGWVLWRFVLQRESHPKIEFGLELQVLGQVRDTLLVNVVAVIANRGTVRHYLRDFWFVLNHLSDDDRIRIGGPEIDGQVQFNEGSRRCYWIQADKRKYFIDAGVTQRYTHVMAIPLPIKYAHVYGHFKYPGYRKRYQSVQQAFTLPDRRVESRGETRPRKRSAVIGVASASAIALALLAARRLTSQVN